MLYPGIMWGYIIQYVHHSDINYLTSGLSIGQIKFKPTEIYKICKFAMQLFKLWLLWQNAQG